LNKPLSVGNENRTGRILDQLLKRFVHTVVSLCAL
jgi:hypothetical protein